jgi:hypothetical protein
MGTDAAGTAVFSAVPDFSAAPFSSAADGSGLIPVTISAVDAVGNTSAPVTALVQVTRLKWARSLAGAVDTVLGSPIVTTVPVDQIILGGRERDDGGPIAALSPEGELLWRAGHGQLTAIGSDLAWSPATRRLYAVQEGASSAYVAHLSSGAAPRVDASATCAGAALSGPPALVTSGGGEYALISDPGAHRLNAYLASGSACSLTGSLQGSAAGGASPPQYRSVAPPLSGPALTAPSGHALTGQPWINSVPIHLFDRTPGSAGELFGFGWDSGKTTLTLYKSGDGGDTVSFVTPSGGAGVGQRGVLELLLSVAQDSTGAVHTLFNDTNNFAWKYERYTLVHTVGAITGWSRSASITLTIPATTNAYLTTGDLKVVVDQAGTERVMAAISDEDGSGRLRVQMVHAPVAATAAAEFVALDGTAGASIIPAVAGSGKGYTTSLTGSHSTFAQFCQHPASRDLYWFLGIADADGGNLSAVGLQQNRITPSGPHSWAIGASTLLAADVASAPGFPGGTGPELMQCQSTGNFVWLLYFDVGSGLTIDRFDSAGARHQAYLTPYPLPGGPGSMPLNGAAALSVSSDEHRVWVLADVYLGGGFLNRIFFGGLFHDGSTWTTLADNGVTWPDWWGMGASSGWSEGLWAQFLDVDNGIRTVALRGGAVAGAGAPAWSGAVGPPVSDGSAIYLGHDGAKLAKAAFSGGTFSGLTEGPATVALLGRPALAGEVFGADAPAASENRYRAFLPSLGEEPGWAASPTAGAPAVCGARVSTSPIVGAGWVLGSFDASDGHLYGFAPTSTAQTPPLRYPASGPGLGLLSGAALGADGSAYFGGSSPPLLHAIALGPSAPAALWTFAGAGPAALARVVGQPSFDATGTLYVADVAGTVFALITDSPAPLAPAAGSTWPRAGFDGCNSGNSAATCR